MSRYEEKSFSDVEHSCEKFDTILEDLAGNVPGWAHLGGAFDSSDIAYMKTQLKVQRQNDELHQKKLDDELALFRLKSMQAVQSKPDTLLLQTRVKRTGRISTVQVKIKPKRRKVSGGDLEKEKSGTSCIQEHLILENSKNSRKEVLNEVTTPGDILGMLEVYSDSD